MAKKPAIIAKIAATPPFATKEVAADEIVGDEAAEVAADPEVLVGVFVPLLAVLVVDPEMLEDTEVPVETEVPDVVDVVPLAPPELAGVVNETELGVAVAPVAERLATKER
jgi:hypothetical protein